MSILEKVRNRKHRALRLAISSAVIAVGIGGMSSTARADGDGSGLSAPIEGTWILSINRVSQGITFTALQSFTAGGVTLATGTIDRTPPPPISPLYGSWKRVGHNRYAVTICFFIFDATGKALGMIKGPETFQIEDDNTVTGSGTALACDLEGDNCADINSPITITGKRLLAQGASD